MRTLTLGVLIVSGGTLAALPFRRYQAIPDASSGPVQATGPTELSISTSKLEMLVDSNPANGETGSSENDRLVAQLPAWPAPTPVPTQPRRMTIPLTYEDLAVPIDQPRQIQQRFNATVAARQTQTDEEKSAALVMPRIESLALSKQKEIQSLVTVVDTSVNHRAPANQQGSDSQRRSEAIIGAHSAKLASSPFSEETVEALPESEPERQRHWIRQP